MRWLLPRRLGDAFKRVLSTLSVQRLCSEIDKYSQNSSKDQTVSCTLQNKPKHVFPIMIWYLLDHSVPLTPSKSSSIKTYMPLPFVERYRCLTRRSKRPDALEKRPATHAVHDVAPERQSQLFMRIHPDLAPAVNTHLMHWRTLPGRTPRRRWLLRRRLRHTQVQGAGGARAQRVRG